MAKLEEITDQPQPPPPKVNNASLSDLKATSDDAIAPVTPLESEKQYHPSPFVCTDLAVPQIA